MLLVCCLYHIPVELTSTLAVEITKEKKRTLYTQWMVQNWANYCKRSECNMLIPSHTHTPHTHTHTHTHTPPPHTQGPYVYELFSIMVHSGSAIGGHYYAYIKSFTDKQWYCFNDQSVSKVTMPCNNFNILILYRSHGLIWRERLEAVTQSPKVITRQCMPALPTRTCSCTDKSTRRRTMVGNRGINNSRSSVNFRANSLFDRPFIYINPRDY